MPNTEWVPAIECTGCGPVRDVKAGNDVGAESKGGAPLAQSGRRTV
jgi:hypothetical protein